MITQHKAHALHTACVTMHKPSIPAISRCNAHADIIAGMLCYAVAQLACMRLTFSHNDCSCRLRAKQLQDQLSIHRQGRRHVDGHCKGLSWRVTNLFASLQPTNEQHKPHCLSWREHLLPALLQPVEKAIEHVAISPMLCAAKVKFSVLYGDHMRYAPYKVLKYAWCPDTEMSCM